RLRQAGVRGRAEGADRRAGPAAEGAEGARPRPARDAHRAEEEPAEEGRAEETPGLPVTEPGPVPGSAAVPAARCRCSRGAAGTAALPGGRPGEPVSDPDLVVVWRVYEPCNLACRFCGYDRGVARPRHVADPGTLVAFAEVLAVYQERT